jgi:hypothetical protein
MSDHLSVRVRGETRASQLELLTQFAMIFDDAVVNDRNTINRVWMGVLFVWTAMSCPARVADAYTANKRLTSEHALEVREFPDRAPPRKETAFKGGNAGGIIPSIFKPPQRIQHRSGGWPSTHETNDSTHLPSPIHLPSAVGGTRVVCAGR